MTVLEPHHKQGDTPNPPPTKPDNFPILCEYATLHVLYLISSLIRESENAMLNSELTDMQVALLDLQESPKKWALRELHLVHICGLVTEDITPLPESQAADLLTLCRHFCWLNTKNAAVTPEFKAMVNAYASNASLLDV